MRNPACSKTYPLQARPGSGQAPQLPKTVSLLSPDITGSVSIPNRRTIRDW